jgi:membrane-associated phospholipid phosphatase
VTEVILAAGTVVQILKHSTGRESPFVATKPTGRWDFFPNQIEYHKKIPHYDAYPSGHVCTALATLTVIMENYPEATWLPYVGYPAVTWLAISMVGQGIHWVSDYPVSVAIGFGFGQIVSHKKSFSGKFSSIFSGAFSSIFGTTTKAQILPARFADGTMGAQIVCSW